MRIVLAGGGTGGHAYPALSLAAALKKKRPDCELLYMGSKSGVEACLAEEQGIPYKGITCRKLSTGLSPKNIIAAASLGKGLVEAFFILGEFKPDVVIGTGGYAAAAVMIAQVIRRGKMVILEADTIPGRTNLRLGRFASRICLAFEEAEKFFPAVKIKVTGMPIRLDFRENLPSKKEARKELSLDPDLFTILVVGGSQGARRLNEVVADAIPEIRKLPVQILHQSGLRNFDDSKKACEAAEWGGYSVRAYFDDILIAYASADLVVCRCGTSTISEVTAVGLPAILVPYPYSHAGHQQRNGEVMESKGAGLLIDESELTGASLTEKIRSFLESPDMLKKMACASREMGKPDAALDVAELVLSLA